MFNFKRKVVGLLDIVTKMQVNVSSDQVFEAFVNPDYIGGFWFSSSSERWEEGKTITLRYEEYHARSEEHTSELQSRFDIVCRLLLEKKKQIKNNDKQ